MPCWTQRPSRTSATVAPRSSAARSSRPPRSATRCSASACRRDATRATPPLIGCLQRPRALQPVRLDRRNTEVRMSESVLYLSMSLDGYIAGPNDEPGNPGGDEFMRLHDWYGFGPDRPDASGLESFEKPGLGQRFLDEINATGAVLAGRRTVEQVDHWKGDHHGVPIFVPSHRPPGPSVANYPLVTYVADGIVGAMVQAKAAAGGQNVLVHGAYTAQAAL